MYRSCPASSSVADRRSDCDRSSVPPPSPSVEMFCAFSVLGDHLEIAGHQPRRAAHGLAVGVDDAVETSSVASRARAAGMAGAAPEPIIDAPGWLLVTRAG